MVQEYSNYTEADFEVWKLLFNSQVQILQNRVCKEFTEGMKTLQFTSDKIPSFKETNKLLLQATGWQIHVVPGLIPAADFFSLLHAKKFCSSTWLRKKEQLKYLEEPDMFHDVFGHVPFLANENVSNFLRDLAGIALRYIDSDEAIELIARLYWFTIEFGLVKDGQGEVKIFGAGIVSSPGETVYSLEQTQLHSPFDVQTILQTDYRKDVYQSVYFVLESVQQLEESVGELNKFLAERFKARADFAAIY